MWKLLIFFVALQAGAAASQSPVFKFGLLSEPHSLDPQSTSTLGGNYLFQNLYRGLYSYNSRRGLVKAGAKSCERSKDELTCKLNSAHHWSDGTQIKASDYVRSFRHLIDPSTRSPQVELILSLKNAKEILSGKLPPARLGVTAVDDSTLKFEFAYDDPEFEFKLINPSLSPRPASGILEREQSPKMLFSGPYKVESWMPGHYVRAVANTNYGLPSNPKRPPFEALFLEDDTASLDLYEHGELSFLRRLPLNEVPRFRSRKDFIRKPMARWDYMGFGPELKDHPNLREALALSMDYAGFNKLFENKSPPGCPGLNPKLMDRTRCLKFDPARAKKLLRQEKNIPPLTLWYSQMGGDDLTRMAEWIQGQWKKNLGLTVELKSEEQLVYLRHLRANAPTIFLKGIGLDRPTCLAAMELFSQEQPENYIHYNDAGFEKRLQALRAAKTDSTRKVACRKAVEYFRDSYRSVAFGQRYFFILVGPEFTGWDLNEVNQLDLSELSSEPTQ